MLQFQNPKIGIPILFIIFSWAVMGLHAARADSIGSADTKMVFNSLESFQLSCFADDSDGQREPDLAFTEEIVNLAASNNPEQRISALSRLAEKSPIDAVVVQKILQKAILDKNANVRGQAVYAIAQQACADFPILLEQALNDSELSVRLMAVDSFGADEESVNLLEQALNDDEEAVRELAALKLESLSVTHNGQ